MQSTGSVVTHSPNGSSCFSENSLTNLFHFWMHIWIFIEAYLFLRNRFVLLHSWLVTVIPCLYYLRLYTLTCTKLRVKKKQLVATLRILLCVKRIPNSDIDYKWMHFSVFFLLVVKLVTLRNILAQRWRTFWARPVKILKNPTQPYWHLSETSLNIIFKK